MAAGWKINDLAALVWRRQALGEGFIGGQGRRVPQRCLATSFSRRPLFLTLGTIRTKRSGLQENGFTAHGPRCPARQDVGGAAHVEHERAAAAQQPRRQPEPAQQAPACSLGGEPGPAQ